ncbi:MAG TPA: outer membrane beta-barrel protein [Rhizobiales bacterium]|nr:outer membrane beta-barrel protein [Hyphomicrobiales bacterium]
MARLWTSAVLLAVVLPACTADARADMLDRLLGPWTLSEPYAGAGFSHVHHTGYASGGLSSTEQWKEAAKAFAGFRFSEAFSGEIAYHALGSVAADGPGSANALSTLRSQAVAVSLIAKQPLSDLPWTAGTFLEDARLYARAGAAFRWTRQTYPGAAPLRDSGPAFVLGFGFEQDFGDRAFLRAEYEYIGKSGLDRTVDVQNTPVSVSLGIRF